ncbi:MAG: type II toxin-antitoxin system HicA family toxin [Chloroflexi bacterium]|nr:type II toxin-antitoxin system HicA family toxin [Chloroflexota bacterium]
MPKLRTLSDREICRILTLNGFERVRQRGSHIYMRKRILQVTGEYQVVTVPVPNHKEVRKGTLSGIIRQSQLPRELFE